MTLEQALEKANDGGWKTTLEPYRSLSEAIALALLDPLFWSALGKSMGWDMATEIKFSAQHVLNEKTIHLYTEKISICEWYWHDFISHLAEGKSIEDYFKNL